MTEDSEPKKQTMLSRPEAAAIVYNDLKEFQRTSFSVFAEYGKWLISSLVLIHSGALFGLFSFLDTLASNPAALGAYKFPIWCFVAGLFLALVCGFLAWINWGMHFANAQAEARADMLWDPDRWVGKPIYVRSLDVTYIGSIVAGVASALCILFGAAMILHGDYLLKLIVE